MSNEIEIFNNAKFGNIHFQKDDKGEPLFCLADVCRALEIDNASQVKQQVCEEFELPILKIASFDTGFGFNVKTVKFTNLGKIWIAEMWKNKNKSK